MDINQYKDRPNRLLVEIGLTAAQYGLVQPAMGIARYLGSQDATRCPAMLIMGLLNVSMGNYQGAKTIFQTVCDTELFVTYHPQAKNLLSLVDQLKK